MTPVSGSSRPASILSSVVLPAPFGPHKPTRSRSPTCHVTCSRSTFSPNALVTSWSCSTNYSGVLLSQRSGCGRKDLRHAEGFREISRHTEVDRFDGARLGGEAGDDDDR